VSAAPAVTRGGALDTGQRTTICNQLTVAATRTDRAARRVLTGDCDRAALQQEIHAIRAMLTRVIRLAGQ